MGKESSGRRQRGRHIPREGEITKGKKHILKGGEWEGVKVKGSKQDLRVEADGEMEQDQDQGTKVWRRQLRLFQKEVTNRAGWRRGYRDRGLKGKREREETRGEDRSWEVGG